MLLGKCFCELKCCNLANFRVLSHLSYHYSTLGACGQLLGCYVGIYLGDTQHIKELQYTYTSYYTSLAALV